MDKPGPVGRRVAREAPAARHPLHREHHRRRSGERQARGPRAHALSRPSPTATCTSATPRRSASTSAWPRATAACATCASTTPTRARKRKSTSESIQEDVKWLGFDWEDRCTTPRTTSSSSTSSPSADRKGQGLRRRPERRGDPRAPRHADRARQAQPAPRPSVEENLDLFRTHARRASSRRLARAAGQDRHGLGQPQPARPGDVPHPARHAPAHRRRLVHLPDVRLRPRPVGFDRGHHALALHAGVRGPPPALRLVPGARSASTTRSRSSSRGSS